MGWIDVKPEPVEEVAYIECDGCGRTAEYNFGSGMVVFGWYEIEYYTGGIDHLFACSPECLRIVGEKEVWETKKTR